MNTPDFRNYKNAEIDKTIDAAMTSLRTITGNSMDLNIMNVKICSVKCALVSIEGMISTSAMSELIFRPIMELSARKSKGNAEQVFDFLTKESLLAAERKTVFNYGDVIQFLFSGFAVIFVEGLSKAVVYGIQGYDKRSVSEPASEQTIMCAQDSFTETIRTNISLVRRRMKTQSLRFEMMQIGKRSSTDVCMVYMSDRASSDAVDRLRKQLKGIKLDTVLTSGYIEPFIDEGFGSSVFSQMAYSERPDMICTRLNQGRICVFVDGTPFVLICPSLFAENFQTMDDFETTIDLVMDAFIPDTYISNEFQKLDIYKRIAGIENQQDYDDMLEELLDRFGEPGKAVLNLLAVARLKSIAHRGYVTEIKQLGKEVRITLYERAKLNPAGIPLLMQKYGRSLQFKNDREPKFILNLRDNLIQELTEFAGELEKLAEG